MANYQLLKGDIDAKVYQNGHQEITGANLNSVLNAMVTTLGAGYQFAGVATTATNPGTPDAKVFYIANGKGTYTNFGGIEVTEDDVVVLYWDTTWHKVSTGIASQAKLSELEQEVIYDVTANNSGATFASLSALLSSENLSTLIPSEVRCGGMSIRFIQSSDNKYVQFRYMSSSTADADFTNVANWQGIDEAPTISSPNLVISEGVYSAIKKSTCDYSSIDTFYSSMFVNGSIADTQVWPSSGCIYCKTFFEIKARYLIIENSTFDDENSRWTTRLIAYTKKDETLGHTLIDYTNKRIKSTIIDCSGYNYYRISLSRRDNNGTEITCYPTDLQENDIQIIQKSILSLVEENISDITKLKNAVAFKEKTEIKQITNGTIYEGNIETNTSNNLCDAYYYPIDRISDNNRVINIYRRTGIGIRITEYDSEKTYLTSSDYSQIDTYVISNPSTVFIRIAASYPGFSDSHPIQVTDFEDGDFGFELGGSDDIKNLKNKTTELDNNLSSLNITVNGNVTDVSYVSQVSMRPDSSGKFVSGGHRNRYFIVEKDKEYNIIVDATNTTSSYTIYMGYSTIIPVIDGNVLNYNSANTTVGRVSTIKIVSPINGYFSFSIWPDEIDNSKCSVKYIQRGILDKAIEEAKEIAGVSGNDSHLSLQNIYMAKQSLVNNGSNVKMNQLTLVPYDNAELKIVCPSNIVIWFDLYLQPYSDNIVHTTYCGNGDTIKLNKGYNSYTINFADGNKVGNTYELSGIAITVTDIITLIESGSLQILYEDNDIIVNNKDIEKKARAIASKFPTFSHISDVHGDAIRYRNFMKISEYYNVVAAINSGDNVGDNTGDKMTFLNNSIAEYPNLIQIAVLGNHDNYFSGNSTNYQNYYKMFDDAYHYTLSQDKTYYYKDFDNEKIRIIALNIYEDRCIGYSCRISKEQIDWFIDTLNSTPEAYGVLVVAHSTEKWIDAVPGKDNFYDYGTQPDWCTKYNNIEGNPVSSIIDAFISKTSINGTYTQKVYVQGSTSEEEIETVTYSADFTSVNKGVEFIAYINGHKHHDNIGYLSDTNNIQLSLNILQGASSIYYNYNDIPRATGRGSVQDVINLYSIDREHGIVNIVRIGSNQTFNLVQRDVLSIPYKNIEQ